MKNVVAILLGALAPAVLSQSLECQLLRNEILQLHGALTIDKCQIEYQQCLQRAGGDSLKNINCHSYAASCDSAKHMGDALGIIIGNKTPRQVFNEKLSIYKANCER